MGIYDNYITEAKTNISILNESDIFPYDSKLGFAIRVDGSGLSNRNFEKMPYFKLYNSKNFNIATKIARISMLEPKYIIHNNEKWILTSKMEKALAEFLDKDNNWEKICKFTAEVICGNISEAQYIKSLKRPKYENGIYER